ncbi:hypothetical protein, conserved [Trypanosoma brucei brucei TREU927]|uniref:Expression site-associated gene 9 (ESAG9) protein n=1 Tax=Trypanosoma brucei brucei (strain 927/4 GUTat10.1) TaxID=185431 RepID=Q57VG8_TRYB2|nr:hypothetical protein, conserved [Trypanosoma brucei brucei TREU927]AAX70401.1 hypothetical protein, conserved [Trypanosoma brucei]AAZ10606.1 hypothetical protein, conserved [Trypanosoma brucei brucei TREU927]
MTLKIAVTLLLTLRASTPYTILSSEVQVSMGRSRCNTYFAPPGYDDCKSVDSQVRPTASGVTSAASPSTSEQNQAKTVAAARGTSRPTHPTEVASSSSSSHKPMLPSSDSRGGGVRRADNTGGGTTQSSNRGSSTNAPNFSGQAPSRSVDDVRSGETAQGPARVGEEQNRDAEKRKGMSVELATQHDGRHATEQQSAPSVAGGERGEGVKAVGKHSMDENEDGISRRQVSGRDDDYVASAMRGGAPKPEVSRPSEVITTDADEGSSSGGSTQKGNGVDQRRHATLYPALLTFIFC